MARALLVGCGCRGRELGRTLIAEGWLVRGTTRDPANAGEIEAAGIEPALADPDRVSTVLDHVGDVTVLCWLLGSATGDPQSVAAIHGHRLERLLEELVDTPVRGFLYEAAGSVESGLLDSGGAIVRAAAERWRIPAEVVDADPAVAASWADAMRNAVQRLIS